MHSDRPPSLEVQMYLDKFPEQTPQQIFGEYVALVENPTPVTRLLHAAFAEAVQIYPLDNRDDLSAVKELYEYFIKTDDEGAMGHVLMSLPNLRQVDPSAVAQLMRLFMSRWIATGNLGPDDLNTVIGMAHTDLDPKVRVMDVERWRRGRHS